MDSVNRWKRIEHFPDYEISDSGIVRRAVASPRISVPAGKVIKQHISYGYAHVRLYRERKNINCLVHRLVTHAFLGPCPHGQQVDHINFNRTDNRIGNLRYLTPKANVAHSVSFGRNYCGERHHSSKLCSTDVSVIRFLLKNGYPILRIARFFNVNRTVIQGIARDRIWKSIPK